MINGEGGVSDFAQVYNFCVINDLKVKEWVLKILNDNPDTLEGHSFNLQKFCKVVFLIDVAKCIYFYNSDRACLYRFPASLIK
jgi:hypothetical protein